jgi:septum formation protein
MTMGAAIEVLPLVLVSASPLCRQVLAAAGFLFRAVDPLINGSGGVSSRLRPVQQAEAKAYLQAKRVAEQSPDACVLATTTLVALGELVLGSPHGRAELTEMLRAVSGRRHAVVTGVAVIQPGRRLLASEVTYVTMRPIPEEAIVRHLSFRNGLGVSSAYATPDMVEGFVMDLEGSFSNLLGMPVDLVDRMIRELGRHPDLRGSHRIVAA